jgi:hypothetical protein
MPWESVTCMLFFVSTMTLPNSMIMTFFLVSEWSLSAVPLRWRLHFPSNRAGESSASGRELHTALK